jgi:hypothetical protein
VSHRSQRPQFDKASDHVSMKADRSLVNNGRERRTVKRSLSVAYVTALKMSLLNDKRTERRAKKIPLFPNDPHNVLP